MKINVTRSSMPSLKEYEDEIKELWESRWLTNYGKKHNELENLLKNYLSVNNLSLFSNGHLALEYIISSFNFPRGSEIITTPFTFVSTSNAIVRCGLIPVFCDINKDDFTIDVNKIENLITDKTVAILPVHVYGLVCDVEAIENIAKKHNLKVIYDAAHAFGVEYKGKGIANFGDASMFSFHATKVFHTVEGGAIAYKDEKLKQYLDCAKDFGITSEEECLYVGGNSKMNEFQAAMGICNLRHIQSYIDDRKKITELYLERLKGIYGIVFPKRKDDVVSNYAYFPILFDGYKYGRDEIKLLLEQHGINARKYFYPIVSEFQAYSQFKLNKTPIAKDVSEKILCLPIYPDLSLETVNEICDIILGIK